MPAVATTLRIDPFVKEQLNKLGELRKLPMNKLVNQALEQIDAQESLLLEAELEASLKELKKLRKSDPDFEKSIERFSRSELSTPDDPVEGQAFFTSEHKAGDTEHRATNLAE